MANTGSTSSTAPVSYRCVWKKVRPISIVKAELRSLFADLPQEKIEKLAQNFFTSRPNLDHHKPRPYVMLMEDSPSPKCVRRAFSRSKTGGHNSGFDHAGSFHSSHECFIDSDARIQVDEKNGFVNSINVFLFQALDSSAYCDSGSEGEAQLFREYLKHQFPNDYLCRRASQ